MSTPPPSDHPTTNRTTTIHSHTSSSSSISRSSSVPSFNHLNSHLHSASTPAVNAPSSSGLLRKIGTGFKLAGQMVYTGTRATLETGQRILVGGKETYESIDENRGRLSSHDERILRLTNILTLFVQKIFLENREKNQRKIVKAVDEAIATYRGQTLNPNVETPQTAAGSQIGGLFENNAELLNETIAANLWNLIANLSDQAYPQIMQGQIPSSSISQGDNFPDSQRNVLGRLLGLFSLESFSPRLEAIKNSPEENQLEQYDAIFDEIAAAFFGRTFPNGASDLLLFHHLVPVETIRNNILVPLLFPMLKGNLKDLLKGLYFDTLPLVEIKPQWVDEFDQKMAIPGAHGLVHALSSLIQTQIIDTQGATLREQLHETIHELFTSNREWLVSNNFEIQPDHDTEFFIQMIQELFETRSPTLKGIGSFLERAVMERLLDRLSATMPDDAGLLGGSEPLLVAKLRQLLEGPILEQIVEIFQADEPEETKEPCHEIVLRVRTLLGLNTRHNFPLPPTLMQMDGVWALIEELFDTTIPEKLQTKLIWPAIRKERYNDELIRSIEDPTAHRALMALIPKFTVLIVDAIRNPSTLQSIITNLPVTLTEEQVGALNAQWIALFADPEGRVVTNIKQTLGRLLEPLVTQVFVDMHAIYLHETNPPSSSTGEQAPRKEFNVWIVEKITAALNEVAIDQFNPGERAALIRIEEIRQLLKTELTQDLRQELSLELKDRTLVMRVKFQRAANRLLQAFGYRQPSDLPIPAMGQQALWKAIPDLFLEYGAPLLIPAFALEQNRAEIADRMDDPAAVIGTNMIASALSGIITNSVTGVSLLNTLTQSLTGVSNPTDIAAFSRQWKVLFGIQDVPEESDQNVNQAQVQNAAPSAPQNVSQNNPLMVNIKNLFGFLLNPLFAQLFVDLRRTYDLEVPLPVVPADGAQPEPRKEFTVWVIEKITAALNEVGVDRFNPAERAALIRVDELQNLLKTELTPDQKQQYTTELEACSLVAMPKFEQASAALFRAFGYEGAANLPIPAMGQKALWKAVPKLLLEHGTALIAPSLGLDQNRAQILGQIHDPSPINGINVIVSSLGGLLAGLITGSGLLKKLSTSLAKTETPENVTLFNDLWNTFFTPPPAPVNPAPAVAGGEVQNAPQDKPLVAGLSKVLTHLLNPVFTQLFVDLQDTYLAETAPPVAAAEEEAPQPRQEFALWVVHKLTTVFNELTIDRFPVEQRDILKRALLLKEQVSVESDPVRKQQIAQELEACWTVIKPRFVEAAARLYQTFGYQEAADLPLPHGQEPLWNYIPELIFDFMSDPLVPFLEKEECKAALRAHDFGDGLRAHGLGELIIQGCQVTSADLINNLPQYVNSYEAVLRGFNQEAGLPYRLTEGQIPVFAARVAGLVEANQLTTETLHHAFEASFLFAHPAYTPQQRTAVMALVQRYKKQVSTILITPEKIAEGLSALNATPAVKAQLAQQIQTLVHRVDGPSQPVKEFIGSYIEGMLLLMARQALTLNQETLQAITTLFQETRTRLNQRPRQEDPIIAEAEAKEIITEFTDQLFAHLGVASTLDVRGIPFSLGKKLFNEMKKQIVSKLFTVHQIDRLLGLHELELQANQPANEGTIEQRAIFGAIQSALRSAAVALVKPVPPAPGQPPAAQPQLQVIQDLYTSLRTSLSALGREGFHGGEMLQALIDNDTFTPYLSSFLVSVNSPENATYQSTATQLLTPIVTEKVTRILGMVTEKERVQGSDFHQGVLKEMMRTFNMHMTMMNSASQMPGGVNFENYRQAHVEANLPIHPAVPTAAATEANKGEQSAQRQAGFFMPMIEDVIQLVFPQGMDELMNLLRNIHPELVALWESSKRSIGETASSELEKLFKSDVFVTIMNSILESIVNALRQPIVFAPTPAPAARQVPANGVVREVQPLAGNGPNNVLPVDVPPATVDVPPANGEVNPQPANGPQQHVQPRGPNEALNGEVDALIGECINESVRFLDVPLIKSILGMSPEMKQRLRIDRLEGSVYQSIGNAIREQFQGAPIQAGITKAFRELAQTANSGVGAATGAAPGVTAGAHAAVVPGQVQPPATVASQQRVDSTAAVPPVQAQTPASTTSQRQGAPAAAVTAQARRGAPAAATVQVQAPVLTPQQRLTQLKGELVKELMVYPFRYMGAYIRHKTTSNYRVVNAITNVVLGLLSFVMTKIIGNALRAFKVDRLTKIYIENLINNVENRLSLVWTNFQMNENLIYNEVEAFKRAMNENRNDGREEEI